MYALLFAEGADEIAVLSLVLQRAGMTVSATGDLERALQGWAERPPDLIVMAIQRTDPMPFVRRVRAETEVALILVADATDERSQCALLEHGADLFVPRPFSARLLIAQVRALVRRSNGMPIMSLPTLQLAGLTLNPETRTVQVTGRPPQRLTYLEFRLLYTLMIHRGQVIPTDTIVERVWGYGEKGDRDLVRGLISRLRAKIESDPQQPRFVMTVSGVGYSFRKDSE